MILRLVLAAGAARRLGEPKATARLGGSTFLERVLSPRLPGAARDLVVTGGHREATEAEARRLGVATVHNEDWESGQGSSLARGLREARPGEAVLLHPVDFPLVTQDDCDRLLAAYHAEGPGVDRLAVLSQDRRRGHPVLFGPAWVERILALPPGGTPRDLFRAAGEELRYALTDNAWVRRDIDTPDDLAAARAYLGED
ncbi:MAG: nucleotidyltransferase family protein [Planctomycetota bacterium]